MTETPGEVDAPKATEAVTAIQADDMAMRLMAEMLANRIVSIIPQLDFAGETGFTYPAVEQALDVKTRELIPVLESLAEKGILKRQFFERLLRCLQCRSVNLRPSTHCPRCGSGDIVRGRVLEHMLCKYMGLEEEFAAKGKYVCPKCKVNLRTAGSDYQSMGLLRKCRECNEIFSVPTIKWRCLKCSSLAQEDEVSEVSIYAYDLDETKRSWLEFELQPKAQLIELLKQHGYTVTKNASVKGRSGAEHSIDILATRDDGVVTHAIAIGVEVVGTNIGLYRIFDFDSKTYDSGFHDRILIVIPELSEEAQEFASQQRIKVLRARDLETVLASSAHRSAAPPEKEPFEFVSRSHLVQYLNKQGYEVQEGAEVKGRSGGVHGIDILATRDEGFITHRIAIDIEVDEKPVELNRIFDFDDKAYDAGIPDKVFIAVPGLNKEARAFAKRQRIRVFEVEQLEPPVEEDPESSPPDHQ